MHLQGHTRIEAKHNHFLWSSLMNKQTEELALEKERVVAAKMKAQEAMMTADAARIKAMSKAFAFMVNSGRRTRNTDHRPLVHDTGGHGLACHLPAMHLAWLRSPKPTMEESA